jgi:hypothetical protein
MLERTLDIINRVREMIQNVKFSQEKASKVSLLPHPNGSGGKQQTPFYYIARKYAFLLHSQKERKFLDDRLIHNEVGANNNL